MARTREAVSPDSEASEGLYRGNSGGIGVASCRSLSEGECEPIEIDDESRVGSALQSLPCSTCSTGLVPLQPARSSTALVSSGFGFLLLIIGEQSLETDPVWNLCHVARGRSARSCLGWIQSTTDPQSNQGRAQRYGLCATTAVHTAWLRIDTKCVSLFWPRAEKVGRRAPYRCLNLD